MPIDKPVRLKANALFITVIIALVIALLCSMVLLLAWRQMDFESSVHDAARLDRDFGSVVDRILADTAQTLVVQQEQSDLFDNGEDSVTIKRENWGLFGLADARVVYKGKDKTRAFFTGQATGAPLNGCLYLADHDRPLSLTGNTRLVGDAVLPKAGVNAAMIGQHSFTSPQLVQGSIRVSPDSLPLPDNRLINHLLRWSDSLMAQPGDAHALTIGEDWQQSFADTAVVIRQKGPIRTGACHLKGHIILVSDSIIEIGSRTQIQDVLVVAPVIKIEDGFSGRLQALASDSILVGSHCGLSYPSTLVLLKRANDIGQPVIRIGDSCRITGVVLTRSMKSDDLKKTCLETGKQSLICGYVYVSGYSYLQGAVNGAVLTDYFIYRTPLTYYENYLVDVEIDREALSKYFIGPDLFNTGEINQVVQWVD